LYINVEAGAPHAVALREPDDFGSFKVVVRGMAEGDPRLADVLEPYGRLNGEGDVLLRIDGVKALAADRGRDAEWLAQLDGMVAYAHSRGWLSEDGSAIQAHCEYPS
jgi:hypothetical protein